MRLAPLLILLIVGLLAPDLAPHPPDRLFPDHVLEAPSRHFPLGTDALGRCLASRLIFGARLSLTIAMAVVVCSGTMGLLLGVLAGWRTGAVAWLVGALGDVALALPAMILGLVVAGVHGPGLASVLVALIATSWVRFARVAEAVTRRTLTLAFVESVTVAGAGPVYVVRHHLLPELAGPMLVLAVSAAGSAMLQTAALSFLGLGVMPPQPEWGTMIYGARAYLGVAPRLAIAPGLAIWTAVASLHVAGGFFKAQLSAALPGGWDRV